MSRKTSDVFRTAFLTVDGTFDTNDSQLFFRPLQTPLNPASGNFYSLAPAQGVDPTIRINQYDSSGALQAYGYPYDTRFNTLPPGTLLIVGGGTPIPSIPNVLVFSQDGNSWLPATNGSTFLTGGCLASAYNGISWMAGGIGTYTVVKSGSGRNWLPDGSASDILTTRCNTIATNGPVWIIGGVGATNNIAYSFDGVNWTPSTSDLTLSVNVIAVNSSLWLAGGESLTTGGASIEYSYDGIYWSPSPDASGILINCSALAYNGVRWVAGGEAYTSCIAYSIDGINWTAATNIFTNGCLAVAWNGVQWTAGGVSSGSNGNTLAYSSDGITWTLSPSTTIFSNSCTSLTWQGTEWIAGGLGPNGFATSTDGINWTPSPLGNAVLSQVYTLTTNVLLPYVPPTPITTVVTAQSIIGGTGGAILSNSEDGIQWNATKNGAAIYAGGNVKSLGYSGTLWVAGAT
jgi:hypothetical protein